MFAVWAAVNALVTYLVLHLLRGMAGPWGVCTPHFTRQCLAFLLLGRKAMTNLDSILKGRDITLLAKVYIDKAVVLLVVMYGCESWTIKKAECQRIDAFELWCWRRLLRVPLIARRSNQSDRKSVV